MYTQICVDAIGKCVAICGMVILSAVFVHAQNTVVFEDTVAPFDKVQITAPLDVILTCGTQNRVVLKGNFENSIFDVQVVSDTLQLALKSHADMVFKIKDAIVEIMVANSLQNITVSAMGGVTVPKCATTDKVTIQASDMAVVNIKTDAMHIVIGADTSANIFVAGKGHNLVQVEASSMSDVGVETDASYVITNVQASADVSIKGDGNNTVDVVADAFGDVRVCNAKSLVAQVKSSSEVAYYQVNSVQSYTEGWGKVKQVYSC